MAFSNTHSPFNTTEGLNSLGTLNWMAWALVVIGAITWGVIGIFDVNLITTIFAGMPMLGRAMCVIVGAAGLYFLSVPFQDEVPDAK